MPSAHSFSFSFSSSISSQNGVSVSGSRSAQHMYTDPSGHVTYKSSSQNLGEPAVIEKRKWDRYGRELLYDRDGRRIGYSGRERDDQGRISRVSGERLIEPVVAGRIEEIDTPYEVEEK